jgi:uncharacterized protein YggU (UPF0235/DUF167 family)
LAPFEQPPWLRREGDDWLLDLHVQPGAKCSAAAGEHGGRLKLTVMASCRPGI